MLSGMNWCNDRLKNDDRTEVPADKKRRFNLYLCLTGTNQCERGRSDGGRLERVVCAHGSSVPPRFWWGGDGGLSAFALLGDSGLSLRGSFSAAHFMAGRRMLEEVICLVCNVNGCARDMWYTRLSTINSSSMPSSLLYLFCVGFEDEAVSAGSGEKRCGVCLKRPLLAFRYLQYMTGH